MLRRSTLVRTTMALITLAIYQFGWAGDFFLNKDKESLNDTPCQSCQEIQYNGVTHYGKCFETPSPHTEKCTADGLGLICEENFGDCGGNLKRFNSMQDCMNNANGTTVSGWCSNNAGQVIYTYATVTGGEGAPE